MLKKLRIDTSKYFLLILFLGIFGSITFSNHSHVVDGVTIAHSHPYKSQTGNSPVNHNHSQNGFILIHFFSNLTLTIAILFYCAAILRKISHLRMITRDENPIYILYRYSAIRPRPPTLYLHN